MSYCEAKAKFTKNRLHCIILHLSNRPDELLSTLKRFLGVKREPFDRVCKIPVLPGLNVCGGWKKSRFCPGWTFAGGEKKTGFARVERLRGVKKIPVLPGLNRKGLTQQNNTDLCSLFLKIVWIVHWNACHINTLCKLVLTMYLVHG